APPGGGAGAPIFLRPARSPEATDPDAAAVIAARRDAEQALRRIARWADRLTRFSETSDLERLNAHPSRTVRVGPTLAAVLGAARVATLASAGIVDATLLEARLRAERPSDATTEADAPCGDRGWSLAAVRRGGMVTRRPGIRLDLGGVAKGWIADRAICALTAHPAAVVDADGDLATALAYGERWRIAIADPLRRGSDLAVLELTGLDPGGTQRYGLATSGTTVHRWTHDGVVAHHLIDPRTRRPALTDVIQATVLADTAARAEAAAKTIVILGATAGAAVVDRPGIRASILVTDDGRLIASPSTLRWLA
ncbi:MAG: FAD:protein FMN transferase, partial [Candidatus Limnocylindrales bacterium]